MNFKIFGILLLFAAGFLAFQGLNDRPGLFGELSKSAICPERTPAQQLVSLVNDDFMTLKKSNQLPPQWDSIATVSFQVNSQMAKAFLGKDRPTFQRVKNGTAYLELVIIDLPDEEDPGIIIQGSLFDISTKNKIFEIGRTYHFSKLNSPSAQ